MKFRILIPAVAALLLVSALLAGWPLMQGAPRKSLPAAYTSGVRSVAEGDLISAEASFRQCIAAAPLFGDGYGQLGNVYLLQGKLPQAVQALETAIAQGAGGTETYARLAQAYLDSRKTEEAYWAAEQALRRDPTHSYALSVKGELLLRDDNLAGALECFRSALRQSPEFSLAYLKAGYILIKLQKLEEAAQVLQAGLERDPHNPGLHLQLAESYFARPQLSGAAELAEKHFQLAIPNNPGAASAHGRLAELAARRGDDRQAREHFQRAIELQPQHPDALYGLGQLERRAGNVQEADTYLRRARAQREADSRFAALKARARARPQDVELACEVVRQALVRGALSDAERQIEKAARRHSENREVRMLRASLYQKQGRLEEARAELEIASALL